MNIQHSPYELVKYLNEHKNAPWPDTVVKAMDCADYTLCMIPSSKNGRSGRLKTGERG